MSDSSARGPRTGSVQAGVRRVPDLDPGASLPESNPRLVAKITTDIRDHGLMTFARFMELALTDPEAGYYTGGRAEATDQDSESDRGPGRSGDFMTAPESHPIFGWTMARYLEGVWQRAGSPDRFVVREHGAGSGALAAAALDGLRRSASGLLEAIRYQPFDVSGVATARLRERLHDAALARHLEPADDVPAPGAVIANELLDALPVHRMEGSSEGLLERFIAVDEAGGICEVLGPPSTRALAARLANEGVVLQPGQRAEVCLALDDWVAAAAKPLERGELLVIDYGHEATGLYDPARGSTLRAYYRHHVHGNPLVAIGRQDVTAHVDLTALDDAAEAAGLSKLPPQTQAAFLAEHGLGELLVGLQDGPAATLEGYLAARSAVVRMLDPRATGAFAVRRYSR